MSKRKLLLADDSVTIQKVVNLTFADEGIEVITVGDGDSAMERISESAPDVVLADVHMPGLSGYQICEILRENPATKTLPVVLLVGSFEPFDENEAARVGANAYLTKPFQSIRQLVSQVTDLMESPADMTEEDVAEFVPAADLPDTSDIESLYQQSFSEPESEEGGETGPPRYVDAGMDDEMIETSVAGEDDEVEVAHTETSDGDYPGVDVDDAYSQSQAGAANSPFDSVASDTSAAAASAVARSESEPYFDQFAETEQIQMGDDLTKNDYELDEIELLELPPIDGGQTLEFTTTQSMTAQGGHKEVVSLSPELMEIIVQKVVEKLSDKH